MPVICFLAALVLPAILLAGNPDAAAARSAALKNRLLAPCCWNEVLARHDSPVAAGLRREIDGWVADSVADSDIESRLVARYGRRILAEPPGVEGIWLRVVPVVILVGGLVWVLLTLRRWSRHDAPAPPAGAG
jgi:cytochrome c-type biogenesis protein CcmH/NrfF